MSSAKQPKKHFDVVTYTGNGGTQSIDSLDFSPDLVWIKSRNVTANNNLFDTVRGATKNIQSNNADPENSQGNSLTAFTSDGFDLGNRNGLNGSGNTFVAWCWNAGDTTVTNNDGTIESQVRASQEAGFSVVSYTATGTGADTIGHGLGEKPAIVIIKNRGGGSQDWTVYHKNLTDNNASLADGTSWLLLNSTDGRNNNTVSDKWSDVAPNDSVITLGTSATVNRGGDPHIAYCWNEVPGYSSFGTYLANGSADGPMANCGFKPAIVIMKNISQGGVYGHWFVHDTARDPYNISDKTLGWDTNVEENDSAVLGFDYQCTIDFLNNGFKVNSSSQTLNNVNGDTYVYMAFADTPPFAQATQVLNLTDATNLDVMLEGDTVTTPSGGESEVLSNEGTTLEVTLNEADPFAVGEVVSVSGQGSGTIQSIDSINNTITVSNVTSKFVPNQEKYVIGNTSRRGAMAVSDPASSVLEAASGYQVEHSVGFDATQEQYLSRTPAAEGNRKIWTWSGWVKRGLVNGTNRTFFSAGTGADTRSHLMFDGSDESLRFFDLANNIALISDATFSEVSGWLHVTLSVDTTQSTSSDRVKMYVNGTQLTDFSSSTYPAQNANLEVNATNIHNIGSGIQYPEYFDGYLAEVHFIDGEAMGPETFGYELAGWWLPKSYTGDHGYNGFYLGMRDGIGKDESGNGNNFTLNNLESTVS